MDPPSTAVDAAAYHQRLLEVTLAEVFGELDPGLLARLLPRLTTLELAGGAVLMREGEPSDALYLVLSGRLLAARRSGPDDASPLGSLVLGEIGRGEPIGEMGVISGAPRTASVRALRDCVLARLDGADFTAILQTFPRAGLPLARKLIDRLSRKSAVARRQPFINVCILPLQASLDGVALATRLHEALASTLDEASTTVALHTRAAVERALGIGIDAAEADVLGGHRRLLDWLDQQEAAHTLQVFAAEVADTAWTRLCLRQADLVLLATDADAAPSPQGVELAHLAGDTRRIAAHQALWLLHPEDRRRPQGTSSWLAARPHLAMEGLSHLHTRHGHEGDWRRVARIVAGRATGLVLSGGGARGFAHVGVMQALEERRLEWDFVGGTSIGAVMGFYAATGLPVSRVSELAREAFRRNPTGDVNWVPVMSLLRGRRLKRVIDDAVAEAFAGAPDIEDLWKPFFCVASNCSRQRADVLRRGRLSEALRASVSIPAALPPVLRDGELLVDGGTFNNYPVDVMRAAGAARVIGVDLSQDAYRPLDHAEVPSPWAFLVDRFVRRRDARRYKDFPSLGTTVVNVALMASTSHQKRMRELVDLAFQPDVSDVGLLQWRAFDRVVAIGLDHARAVLATREDFKRS
ncbi:patatin-like phospholipase family protein [Silanimonas sp.]|jgi:NTE family protein|uniref:patatin-like phospholipase family protein n=1 Tax=Silanimonas sp. TaxID=1929290 RepID=UPI0037C7ACF2